MNKIELLTDAELPEKFAYPRELNRMISLGLTDLEPWYLLSGKPLRDTIKGLNERYSERKLVPFARRQDNDDVACWQAGSASVVFIIHDFASKGFEQRGQFVDFYAWLRRAVDDFIEFDT